MILSLMIIQQLARSVLRIVGPGLVAQFFSIIIIIAVSHSTYDYWRTYYAFIPFLICQVVLLGRVHLFRRHVLSLLIFSTGLPSTFSRRRQYSQTPTRSLTATRTRSLCQTLALVFET